MDYERLKKAGNLDIDPDKIMFLTDDEYNSMYDDDHEFVLYDVTSNAVAADIKYTINGDEYYTDENGCFTLKTGEVASFTLTNYHTYYVKEIKPGPHSVNYNCTLDGVSCEENDKTNVFTIDPDSSYEAVFTNKVKTYNLNISKIAYNGNDEEIFKFKIELFGSDSERIDIPTNISSSNEYEIDNINKVLTYNLKSGESIILNDIPINTIVNISEVNHDGYSVVYKSGDIMLSETDTYEFIMDSDKNITVYNIPGVILPETGGSGILPYLISGLVMMGLGLIIYKKSTNRKVGEYQ